jgi:prolyl 4-hydroxylase
MFNRKCSLLHSTPNNPCRRPRKSRVAEADEQSLTFDIEVLSTHPKIFHVPSFLNDVEIAEIRDLASPHLERSKIRVNSIETKKENATRTSQTAWLPRGTSPIVDTIFDRAASILQIPEHVVTPYVAAEDLQVVRYEIGEKYDAHFDWQTNPQHLPTLPTRYVTFLIYLNDGSNESLGAAGSVEEETALHSGGETAFYGANDRKGLAIHPGKGHAIFFYNLLEDGNGDELTMHASLPVLKGVKWLCNLWIWDPTLESSVPSLGANVLAGLKATATGGSSSSGSVGNDGDKSSKRKRNSAGVSKNKKN